ncbi:Mu-like prophage major head subunit gpT family protein [Motilimonas cestriensis]|uniref:Mu-like prophage major head subunit gpT family protein n=1 Tax=Motilimonas cestriensis TaxID=2742685 RepID=A0ABS8W5C4_9GAMM|nr:Mu-like prophage major head subunit gpT family protein [Motilimonas cestriensis]MCE2594166.1 Mu-like prophage major head subunit gpT family protein [Motilimonas cestriensis]
MTMVTAPQLSSLFTGFQVHFTHGLSAAAPQYTKIATVIKSTSKSNSYGWLGKFPSLKKWLGERQILSMTAHSYEITNEDYEATVGVDRNDIEDDELGIYEPLFQEMGHSAAIHPDELVFGLLSAGFHTPCYDGKPFFDLAHPVAENVDGTGVIIDTANMIVDPDYLGLPWFLLDTSRVIKPIIYQERTAPQLVKMDSAEDEAVFMKKEFRYGVDKRCAVGFGFWQMAFAMQKPLNADSLWEAIEAMRAIKGDGDKKLGMKATTLVVPAALEKEATRLLKRKQDAGSSNELNGRIELLVADHL